MGYTRKLYPSNLPDTPARLSGFLGGLFPTPLYHLHPCRRACAGMTTGREQVDCHFSNPFAIPDKCLTSAPTVIPAQAGIQWL